MANSHQTTISKRTVKQVLLVLLACTFLVVLFVDAIYLSRRSVKRVQCSAHVAHLYTAVIHYFQEHGRLPNFADEQGNALWSWRVCFPLTAHLTPDQNRKLDLDRAWNTPENLLVVNSDILAYHKKLCTCPSLYPRDTRSTYVIVTGPGTFWTELSNGRIDDPYKYADMIFMIETTEPKNFWAEPGDEISPEEVIRLYQADPGLVKNSKQRFFSQHHYPKHFTTWWGEFYLFDEIKDVDELKRRLVIPEHELPERPTEPE